MWWTASSSHKRDWWYWQGGTNKPIMDQVLYYVYKNDDNMEKHYPKLSNIDILPSEGRQVTNLAKYD